jgi:ribosome-binding ATPase YchF (GTP1/OBG family)
VKALSSSPNTANKQIQEIVKKKKGGGEEDKRVKEEVNLIKVHYMHVWQHHKVQLIYTNKVSLVIRAGLSKSIVVR